MSATASRMSYLWRTLSGNARASSLRPTSSMTDIPTEAHTDNTTSTSMASTQAGASNALFRAGSLTESLTSSSPTNSSCLADGGSGSGLVDGGAGSPQRASGLAVDAPPSPSQPQAVQRAKKGGYKISGMEPYEYWSLIKSL